MLNRIFPRQIDNDYRGYRLAIWLLIPIVAMRLVIATNSVFFTRAVATGPDGIALDRFGTVGADAVISLFALLGLCDLALGLLGLAVLIRYRTMMPFLYLLLLFQQIGTRFLLQLHPIARSGAPGTLSFGTILNLVLLATMLLGFVLSLSSGAPERERRH